MSIISSLLYCKCPSSGLGTGSTIERGETGRDSQEQLVALNVRVALSQEVKSAQRCLWSAALLPNLGPPDAGVFRLGHGDGLAAPPG